MYTRLLTDSSGVGGTQSISCLSTLPASKPAVQARCARDCRTAAPKVEQRNKQSVGKAGVGEALGYLGLNLLEGALQPLQGSTGSGDAAEGGTSSTTSPSSWVLRVAAGSARDRTPVAI